MDKFKKHLMPKCQKTIKEMAELTPDVVAEMAEMALAEATKNLIFHPQETKMDKFKKHVMPSCYKSITEMGKLIPNTMTAAQFEAAKNLMLHPHETKIEFSSNVSDDVFTNCLHCGNFYIKKANDTTHQSLYCPECTEKHFGREIIEEEEE